MNTGAVVGTGLMAAVALLQPTVLTIQAHDGTTEDEGDLADSGWSALAGHSAINATVWESSEADENRTQQFVLGRDVRNALLDGLYPSINVDHRVLLDGNPYSILTALPNDSQNTATKLLIERVTT